MNYKELISQLQERLKIIWDKIQESSAYQQALEKYEDQSPNSQKIIQIGIVFVALLIMFMVPISNLFSSFDSELEFEAKRELTRELLKTSRDASLVPNIPQAPDSQVLESQIKNELTNLNLIPEQIKSVQQTSANSKLIPVEFSIGAVEVQLQNLNTRQIVDVAFQLSKLHPSVKFTDLTMEASLDNPGYFHLLAKVISLKTPQMEMPREEEQENPRSKKKNNDEESSDEPTANSDE